MNTGLVLGGAVLGLGIIAYASTRGPAVGTVVTLQEGKRYRHRIRVDGDEFDAATVQMAIERVKGQPAEIKLISENPIRFEFTMLAFSKTVTIGKTEELLSPSGRKIAIVVEDVQEALPPGAAGSRGFFG